MYRFHSLPFETCLPPPTRRTEQPRMKGFEMAQTGTVKFFNTEKGFGFIKPDNGGPDIFVHISAVQASGLPGLTENQKVSYETEPDKRGKGPKAVDLEAAD